MNYQTTQTAGAFEQEDIQFILNNQELELFQDDEDSKLFNEYHDRYNSHNELEDWESLEPPY